jgi:hypothetical protein
VKVFWFPKFFSSSFRRVLVAHIVLIAFCCFFPLLMNECVDSKENMHACKREIYFHSIRKLSAYHVLCKGLKSFFMYYCVNLFLFMPFFCSVIFLDKMLAHQFFPMCLNLLVFCILVCVCFIFTRLVNSESHAYPLV